MGPKWVAFLMNVLAIRRSELTSPTYKPSFLKRSSKYQKSIIIQATHCMYRSTKYARTALLPNTRYIIANNLQLDIREGIHAG